jgi:hypothetical protein
MKVYDILTVAALALSLGACATPSASDKASKQTEVRQASQKSLDKFYNGAAQTDTLIIFKTPEAMQKFVDKGWDAGGGVVAQAGAKGESVGPGSGENVIADAKYYTLTPNGLQAGVAGAGTKYWKSTSLN